MGELLENNEPELASVSPTPTRGACLGDAAIDPDVRRGTWQVGYARRLFFTDLGALVAATVIAAFLRFGNDTDTASVLGLAGMTYPALGVAIAVLWWVALAIFRTRDLRIVGHGAEEYARVARTTILVFGWLAILSLLLKWDMSRGYLAFAFPLGLVGLLSGRKCWRVWLARERSRGRAHSRVLVIGGVRSAKRITENLHATHDSGYRVTGVWVPDRGGDLNEWLDIPTASIPVLGTERTLNDALSISEADTVVVTDTEHLGHDGLKDLAWELHGTDVDMFVSPNVIDVAGPRIHVRGVANMPLIHLEQPTYAGARKYGKTLFDRTFALLFLIAASPILLVTAAAVKLTSPGPILYRSERIGVAGEPFNMLKFRSMLEDADQQVTSLQELNEGSGPLFKLVDDPRITSVGRFLRRYSIDEFPQFINVLKGEMSVVGPRPPLRREVEMYEGAVERRLLVKQGITGLWQVSGRSDLSWEETVRLDLDYVENWSMMRDLQIVWKTVRAVAMKEGAY